MKIVYTCPECGSDLEDLVLTTYPPKNKKQCLKCGWSHIESSDEHVLRIPYQPTTTTTKHFISENVPPACKNCPQHPVNGGSGVCHCTLGSANIMW